jgi:hypothetical protein
MAILNFSNTISHLNKLVKIFSLIFCTYCFAEASYFGMETDSPWLTGPLLAPTGFTIEPGHFNIEPYFISSATSGRYNKDWKFIKEDTFWSQSIQPQLQFGILDFMDFQITPSYFWNRCKGVSSCGFGDIGTSIGIQLFKHERQVHEWSTGVRVIIGQVIPIGKYQNLSMEKYGTDGLGRGSWQTIMGISWGNLFYLGAKHFLAYRCTATANIPSSVKVKNLNIYGGDSGTIGKVYPAKNIILDQGFEFTLTQSCTLALDVVGVWNSKTYFQGKTNTPINAPPSWQFSLAPAFEYNFSSNLGLIFGPWFTVAGKNCFQFAQAVFAINYYN